MIPLSKRQGFREGTGAVYYPPQFWRHAATEEPPSIVDRATSHYEAHWKLYFFWTGLIAACLGVAWGISR